MPAANAFARVSRQRDSPPTSPGCHARRLRDRHLYAKVWVVLPRAILRAPQRGPGLLNCHPTLTWSVPDKAAPAHVVPCLASTQVSVANIARIMPALGATHNIRPRSQRCTQRTSINLPFFFLMI